jgi:hypothetical protein
MRQRFEYEVQIDLDGRFNAGATGPGAFGVDIPSEDGLTALNGSAVDGLVAEIARHCLDTKTFTRLFGAPAATTTLSPSRGELWFSDFHWHAQRDESTFTRIAIDDDSGAASDQALVVIGTRLQPAETATVSGRVTFWSNDDAEAAKRAEQISRWLLGVQSFGALRGIGFGRASRIAMGSHSTSAYAPLKAGVSGALVEIDCGVDRAFVNPPAEPVLKNLQRAEGSISGGRLIGVLTRTVLDLLGGDQGGMLRDLSAEKKRALPYGLRAFVEEIDKVRITHAMPVENGGERTPPPPLSLCSVPQTNGGDPSVIDLAGYTELFTVGDAAPVFAPDWKHKTRAHVEKAYQVRSVPTKLRIRTAMQLDQRVPAEGQLFAAELVEPAGVTWSAVLDVSDVSEAKRSEVVDAVVSLLTMGAGPLSETKAIVKLVRLPSRGFAVPLATEVFDEAGCVIVSLATPAVLVNTETHGNAGAFVAYDEYWRGISGGCLSLVKNGLFARESFVGGEYLAKRFREKTPGTNDSYRPLVLTQAGSVFVLELLDPKNQKKRERLVALLRGLASHGLEHNANASDGWIEASFPYSRRNGYGEIRVNRRLPQGILGHHVISTDRWEVFETIATS